MNNEHEKDMKELNPEDLDQVSGGGALEELYIQLKNAGIVPGVRTLVRKQAVQTMLDYCYENGLDRYAIYCNAIYDII